MNRFEIGHIHIISCLPFLAVCLLAVRTNAMVTTTTSTIMSVIDIWLLSWTKSVLKWIIILGQIEYRILFIWWKLNESNTKYHLLIKKIFKYYLNTLKYSNKFVQNCKFSGSLNFSKLENMFYLKRILHILALINNNFELTFCLRNIVQISLCFLKIQSIFHQIISEYSDQNIWLFE